MKKIQVLFFCCNLLLIANYGQSPPPNDSNYVLNVSKSDEFDSINPLKWKLLNHMETGWTHGEFYPTNVSIVDNGVLKLSAISNLSTAGIKSINEDYLYGYYEIYAKLPGFQHPITQLPCSKGFHTCFWTYHQETDINGCITVHHEIDIIEPDGLGAFGERIEAFDDAQSITGGTHLKPMIACRTTSDYGWSSLHNLPPLYNDYHKFGVECLPDKMIYYFDDIPYNIVYDQPYYPEHIMRVVINNSLQDAEKFDTLTPWPVPFYVDYFRYYELNTTNCTTDISITNNTQLDTVYGVRRNITIGNGSTSISLNTATHKTFRASNEITINSEFTAPYGSELDLIITPCY